MFYLTIMKLHIYDILTKCPKNEYIHAKLLSLPSRSFSLTHLCVSSLSTSVWPAPPPQGGLLHLCVAILHHQRVGSVYPFLLWAHY